MIHQLAIVFIAAYMWAKLEVEIEGKHGWAKNLPTWRVEKHILLDYFMNGRPLTGYHFWAFAFVFFIFHLPLFWINSWSWPAECRIMGSILLFWVIEDVLWFIVNPHFGWRRHRQGETWWHQRWLMGLPTDHWGLLLVALVFLVFSSR